MLGERRERLASWLEEKHTMEHGVGEMESPCIHCGQERWWGVSCEHMVSPKRSSEWEVDNIGWECPRCSDHDLWRQAMLKNMVDHASAPMFSAEIDDTTEIRSPNGHRIRTKSDDREDILDLVPHENLGDVMLTIWDGDVQSIWCGQWWDTEDPPTWDDIREIDSDVDLDNMRPIVPCEETGEDPEEITDRTNIATLRAHTSFQTEDMSHVGWVPAECPECGLQDPHRFVLHKRDGRWMVEHRVERHEYTCGVIVGQANSQIHEWIETNDPVTTTDESETNDLIEETQDLLNADGPL